MNDDPKARLAEAYARIREALQNVGITKPIDPFEQYINTIDTSDMPTTPIVNPHGDAKPLTLETLKAARDIFADMSEETKRRLGEAAARAVTATFFAPDNGPELYDQVVAAHGAEFAAKARELSIATGLPYREAVAQLERIIYAGERAKQAMNILAETMKQIGETLARGMQSATEGPIAPTNRHQRRASKHHKQMKDTDQHWSKRSRRKRGRGGW